MKQEEKSQQSRRRILNAAIQEFGRRGYEGASLNTLLSEHGISKGLFYHYFETKDQLYLACAEDCFHTLMEKLKEPGEAIGLQSYFEIRGRFFRESPAYERIFFETLLQPPPGLEDGLANVRAGFEALNRSLFQSVLSGLQLRRGFCEADALEYFTLMQNVLHLRFLTRGGEAGQGISGSYEEAARKSMEVLLYGLVGREEA